MEGADLVANRHILVLNSGSSSIKFATFSAELETRRTWSGALERIGLPRGRFHAKNGEGTPAFDEEHDLPDHAAALDLLLEAMERRGSGGEATAAIGHRVAHGGPDCDCPERVTVSVLKRLEALIPLAPRHQPHNLAGIVALRARLPDVPQVACFDTAFHHALPRMACMTGLPREFEKRGIRRYGYHGLSYEYIVERLRSDDGAEFDRQRIIIAHLGNGASMAAIREGRSVETTMGFSPLSGLLMGTRPGDLDPGIVLYLTQELDMSGEAVETLLYEQSGLLGVSGLSRNMADLLVRKEAPEAAEAIEYFCYRARAHLAALTAALGGLDRLVFTGGIGANAPEIRERICAGLGYLGIEIETDLNSGGERRISSPAGAVVVEALPTDEEEIIAHHTRRLALQESAFDTE